MKFQIVFKLVLLGLANLLTQIALASSSAVVSGKIGVDQTPGLPAEVSLQASFNIIAGELEGVDWWLDHECLSGRNPEGDCLGTEQSFWTPVVRVTLHIASVDLEIGSHKTQLQPVSKVAFISSYCFEILFRQSFIERFKGGRHFLI